MPLKIYTNVINIADAEPDDFALPEHHQILSNFEKFEMHVRVVAEAADGYFDIELNNGQIIPAVSFHHLEGFNRNGPIL